MEKTDKLFDELKAEKVIKFYRSVEPKVTMWHEDGLGELLWYNLLFETSNGAKFIIDEDGLKIFEETEKIIEIHPESKEQIVDGLIARVILEEESLFVIMENNYVFYHDTFFGSELTIDKMENVFDEAGKLK